MGLGGAALLMWWALAFLPAHERLWMVPAGLVLLGIPILACLSLTPGSCGRTRGIASRHEAAAAGLHATLEWLLLHALRTGGEPRSRAAAGGELMSVAALDERERMGSNWGR